MRKIIYLLLLQLFSTAVISQSNVRLNNYLEIPYYINPASINYQAASEYSIVARKQWIGFPGAPSTFFATGTTYIEKYNTQIGAKVYEDKIGFTNTFNVSISYAYSLKIAPDWGLGLGLAANYQNLSYDLSELSASDRDNPVFYTKLLNSSNYNCDLGAQLSNESLTLGMSSTNIYSIFFPENKLQTNSNYLYAKYLNTTLDPVNIQYGVSAVQTNNTLQMKFSLTSYFKYYRGNDLFQAGIFYRTRSEMGVLFGVNLNKSIHLWYSFDFNVGGIDRNTIGTHEVMLIYDLARDRTRNY